MEHNFWRFIEMTDQELLPPGTPTPDSGQYKIVGPRGGDTAEGERTSTEGRPLPPTPKPGQKYIFVDATKHKR
jgi:hypothetical protein